MDWGNPSWGWLNDDFPGDPVEFPMQFEHELSKIVPGFPCGMLVCDWFDKLPPFHPYFLGFFRRRKYPIDFGEWLAAAVVAMLGAQDLER